MEDVTTADITVFLGQPSGRASHEAARTASSRCQRAPIPCFMLPCIDCHVSSVNGANAMLERPMPASASNGFEVTAPRPRRSPTDTRAVIETAAKADARWIATEGISFSRHTPKSCHGSPKTKANAATDKARAKAARETATMRTAMPNPCVMVSMPLRLGFARRTRNSVNGR